MALIVQAPALCSSISIHFSTKSERLSSRNRSCGSKTRHGFRNQSIVTRAGSKPDETAGEKLEEQELSPLEKSLAKGFFRRKLWIAVLSTSLTAFIAGYVYFFVAGNGADEVPIMKYQYEQYSKSIAK